MTDETAKYHTPERAIQAGANARGPDTRGPMSPTLDPGRVGSNELVDNSPSRIDMVNNTAGHIAEVVRCMHDRLSNIAARIDGPRPHQEETKTEVDSPGVFGEIEAKQRITLYDLERCSGWIIELERVL